MMLEEPNEEIDNDPLSLDDRFVPVRAETSRVLSPLTLTRSARTLLCFRM